MSSGSRDDVGRFTVSCTSIQFLCLIFLVSCPIFVDKCTVISRISGGPRPSKQPKLGNQKISLLIDIQNNLKAQESAGFAHWAKINNLKEAARTFNFITEHGITHYEQLQGKVDEVMAEQDRLLSSIKTKEQRIGEIGLLIKHVSAYRENRPVYERYRKSSDKEKFLRGQERQIILFESCCPSPQTNGRSKVTGYCRPKKRDGLPHRRETAGVWNLSKDQSSGKGTGYHQEKCGPAFICPVKGRTGEQPGTGIIS